MTPTTMNQRNVNALAAICEQLVRERGFDGPHGPIGESWWEAKDFTEMAEYLASQGVLVPSALTSDELERIWQAGTERYEGFFLESRFRTELERIAKGESR